MKNESTHLNEINCDISPPNKESLSAMVAILFEIKISPQKIWKSQNKYVSLQARII